MANLFTAAYACGLGYLIEGNKSGQDGNPSIGVVLY